MPRKSSRRSLLIALNAAEDLHRTAVCRLAEEPERWCLDEDPTTAHRLAIPAPILARARRLVPTARRRAAEEDAAARDLGARLITRLDGDYPERLLNLHLPPPVLYVRGEPQALEAPAVALVGSRKASPYGLEMARRLARDLAGQGLVVVSGFAQGVDAAAHRGALEAGGRTVAVLGCGQAVPYPRSHYRSLGNAIAAQGALLSELPLRHPPLPWCFPMRNRVIAALAACTVVVEGARRSGSLITAHHALDLGREVGAVPGRVDDPGSAGPHGLIQDGAALIRDAGDILGALNLPRNLTLDFPVPHARPAGVAGELAIGEEAPDSRAREHRPAPVGTAAKVMDLLAPGMKRTPDELSQQAGIAVEALLGALLDLELTGWVQRLPGPAYRRN